MDQKRSQAVRNGFYQAVQEIEFEGFTFEGMTVKGALFSDTEGNFVVVTPVVKKEDFDATDALEEWAEREAKRAEAKTKEKKGKTKAKVDEAADAIVEELVEL